MKHKIKKLWVAALRSGEYKQGTGTLRTVGNEFCCLGVLCNLHAQANPKAAAQQSSPTRYDGSSIWPSERVLEWAGLDGANLTVSIRGRLDCVAGHNDKGATFAEIADAIEEQL